MVDGGLKHALAELQRRLERLHVMASRWLEAIGERIGRLPPLHRGLIAVAASALLLLQAAWLVLGRSDPPPTLPAQFPASPHIAANAVPGVGTFAIVAFKPNATAGEIAKLFEQLGAEVVEGPRAGIWRVRLSGEAKSKTDAEALLGKLKSADKLVAFAALAL